MHSVHTMRSSLLRTRRGACLGRQRARYPVSDYQRFEPELGVREDLYGMRQMHPGMSDGSTSNQGVSALSKQQRVATTPWLKNKKIIIWIVVIAVLVAIVFIVLIAAARTFHWQIGFTSSQKTTTTTEVTQPSGKKVTTTIENQPAKTLWDWLPLLIQLLGALAIPVVVGFGTAFFTRQQAKTSEANTENQQQEELLRTYFDKISDLQGVSLFQRCTSRMT